MGTRSSSGVCAEACDAVHQLGDPPLEFCVVATDAIDVVHVVHGVHQEQILDDRRDLGCAGGHGLFDDVWTYLKAALAILPGGSDCGRRRGHPAWATALLIAGMGCCTTGDLLFTRMYTDFSYAAMMLPTRLLLDRGLTGLHPATNRRTKAGRARTGDADRA